MLPTVFAASTGYIGYQAAMAKIESDQLMRDVTLMDGTALHTVPGVNTLTAIIRKKTVVNMPMYINTGGNSAGISIPVGGGSETESKTILTVASVYDEVNKLMDQEKPSSAPLVNHVLLDLDKPNGQPIEKRYLNDSVDFKTTLGELNVPHNSIPAYFPLKVVQMKNVVQPQWSCNRWKVLGSQKHKVAWYVAKMRRLDTNPVMAATMISILSGVYLVFNYT